MYNICESGIPSVAPGKLLLLLLIFNIKIIMQTDLTKIASYVDCSKELIITFKYSVSLCHTVSCCGGYMALCWYWLSRQKGE